MKMEEEMKITKIIAEKTNMNIGALPDLNLLKEVVALASVFMGNGLKERRSIAWSKEN